MLEEPLSKYAERDAYVQMGKALTYRKLGEQSAAFGAWLQQRAGLKKGDRVAIMLPNVLQYPIALFGTLRAGLTVVNVNPLYTPRELAHQLNDSGASAILVLENFASVLQGVLPQTRVKHIIVTSIGEMLGFPKGTIVDYVVRHRHKAVPAWNIPHAVRFRATVREGAGLTLERRPQTLDDICVPAIHRRHHRRFQGRDADTPEHGG